MAERLTPEKKAIIAKLARESRLTYREIGQRFGVSVATVSKIAIDAGCRRSRKWTDAEVAFLMENYQTRGARGCGRVLGRDYSVVSLKARELGLKTNVGPYGRMRVIEGGDNGE